MYRDSSSQDVQTLFLKTCIELRNQGITQVIPKTSYASSLEVTRQLISVFAVK